MRTFVALEISSSVLQSIASWLTGMAQVAPEGIVRWVRPENIHLTLAFLGKVSAAEIGRVTERIERVAEQSVPVPLSVGGLGAFPNLRTPRVIWVGVAPGDGSLAALEGRIQENLRGLGWEPSDQPFRPHLTLGRVRRDAPPEKTRELRAILQGSGGEHLGSMTADKIGVFQSDLAPDGAIYSRIAGAHLTGHP